MSDHSKIEWTDATWNPLVGCSRVSAGCVNCYAERHAYRFARQTGTVYEGTARLVNGRPTFTGRVNLNERVIDLPLRWKRPRRIFVNSMSDLFHESVPGATIDRIFAVMALAPQHTFQVLTKRPMRMRDYLCELRDSERSAWRFRDAYNAPIRPCVVEPNPLHKHAVNFRKGLALPNVWLGVSVEDQAAADERIPLLLQTPSAVRFLSCEPLLGPIVLSRVRRFADPKFCNEWLDVLRGDAVNYLSDGDARIRLEPHTRIDWVIAGGESGPRANPMHPDWARSLRDQCAAARVPFFFKQWGEYAAFGESDAADDSVWHGRRDFELLTREGVTDIPDGRWPQDDLGEVGIVKVGKKAAGRLLDGIEHNAYPEPRS